MFESFIIRFTKMARNIPGAVFTYRLFHQKYEAMKLNSKSAQEIFTDIYQHNKWRGVNSVSGPGSDHDQTKKIIEELPVLFKEYEIESILDIPCGDFFWMQHINLNNINYIGGDIVKNLIDTNSNKYQSENKKFMQIDIIKSPLPTVDLIFCRDCFIHLSFSDIFLALRNICESSSKYLLTTTYTGRAYNRDIITGQGRLMNLEISPFFFPNPLQIINEGCTEKNGQDTDKSLALWKVEDIKMHLEAIGK